MKLALPIAPPNVCGEFRWQWCFIVLLFVCVLGQAPSKDMSPTSGTIYFVSNEARQMIRINILSDDEPEGKEVWYLIPVHSLMQKSPITIIPGLA